METDCDSVVTSAQSQNNMPQNGLDYSQDALNKEEDQKECKDHQQTFTKIGSGDDVMNLVSTIKQEPEDILIDTDNDLSTNDGMEDKEKYAVDLSNRDKDQLIESYKGCDNCDNKDKLFFCTAEGCNIIFISKSAYELHQRLHSHDKIDMTETSQCNEKVKVKHELEASSETESEGGISPRQNERCNEKESVQHQVPPHNWKKVFLCEFDGCTKIFPRQSDLTRHTMTHTKEKPYSCPFDGCDLVFGDKSVLYRHYKKHTNDRSYICKFGGCEKSFYQHKDLITHYRTHTGEKPYSCPFDGCSMAFADKSNLRRHSKTHSGEKPFPCQFNGCKKSFARRSDLTRHSKTHNKSFVNTVVSA